MEMEKGGEGAMMKKNQVRIFVVSYAIYFLHIHKSTVNEKHPCNYFLSFSVVGRILINFAKQRGDEVLGIDRCFLFTQQRLQQFQGRLGSSMSEDLAAPFFAVRRRKRIVGKATMPHLRGDGAGQDVRVILGAVIDEMSES